jgi:hypothetical protein
MLKRIPVLLAFLLTAFAVACGGGGGGALSGGGSSNSTDPKTFTTQYYTTLFATLAGNKSTQDFVNFFQPSCRDNVKIADVTRGIQSEQTNVPKIKGAKIDNVDFGDKFKSTKKDSGYTVTIPSSRDSRIHVDGKWVNAHDYLKSIDFEDDSSGGTTDDINLVLVDKKLYVDDCDSLASIAEPSDTSTPTPRAGNATATPRGGSSPTATPRSGSTPSGGSGTLSTADANTFAKNYFITILGALAGNKTGQDVINVYAPECAKQVKVADVTNGINKEAQKHPKLKGAKVDDFDFGNKLTVSKSGNGYTVTAPSSNDTKVKINGTTQNLHTYLMSVGLEDSSDGDDTTDISVSVINGKAYNSDCDELAAIAS